MGHLSGSSRWNIFSIAICLLVKLHHVSAQSLPSNIPTCAQTCLTNMNDKSSEFNCSYGEMSCLCQYPDYGYGVRDCVNENCVDVDPAAAFNLTATYILDQCAANGVTPGGSTPSASASTQPDAPTGSSTTRASSTRTSTSSISASATNSSSSGLSTGAKAGIGLGVTLGSLGLIAVGAFLIWRRTRGGHQRVAAHFPEDEKVRNSPRSESPRINEVDGTTARHEIGVSGGKSDAYPACQGGAFHELPVSERTSHRTKGLFQWR